MIPTREECLGLMGRFGMFSHIMDHSIEVAKVALFLCEELNKRGQTIDVALVEAASLLHDVAKAECLQTKKDHAVAGCQFLREMGYEKVGKVVAEHVRLSCEKDPVRVSEEEVVNYADKRVRHDRIVSLRERFNDLKERYGKGPKGLQPLEQLEKVTLEIEYKIFAILGMDPENLQKLQ